ncbi:MAG: hypothetical protein LUC06_05860, partial [Oscillospiraceae bacterium]|nr:hypothetical protein [Oscillospiraceae bacterium]
TDRKKHLRLTRIFASRVFRLAQQGPEKRMIPGSTFQIKARGRSFVYGRDTENLLYHHADLLSLG